MQLVTEIADFRALGANGGFRFEIRLALPCSFTPLIDRPNVNLVSDYAIVCESQSTGHTAALRHQETVFLSNGGNGFGPPMTTI